MPPTTTIESRTASLADSEDTIIEGIAIGENDVTRGVDPDSEDNRDILKLWPADALREAAATLSGQEVNLLHSSQSVGEVTNVWYEDGVGIKYRARIDDETLAAHVDAHTVSIEARHFADGQVNTARGPAVRVSDPTFTGMAVVQNGAAPSATAQTVAAARPDTAICADVRDAFAADGDDDDAMAAEGDVPDEYRFDNPGEAVEKAQDMGFDEGDDANGEDLIHTHGDGDETVFMPGPSHDALVSMLDDESEAEAAAHPMADTIEAGDIVSWSSQGNRPAAGRVIETIDEGQYDTELSGDATVNAPAALIRLYRPTDDGEWGRTDVTVAHRTDTETLSPHRDWPEAAAASGDDATAAEPTPAVESQAASPEAESDEPESDERAEPRVRQQSEDTDTDTPMTDENNPDDPKEPAEATELKAKLADKTDRIETLEAELADVREERDEYEQQADAVGEAEQAFAAALADHVPREADALRADLGLSQMRDWLDDIDEADVGDAATTDPEPDVRSGANPDGTDTATLSAAEQDEREELQARLAELNNGPLADADGGTDSFKARAAEKEAERIEDQIADLEGNA